MMHHMGIASLVGQALEALGAIAALLLVGAAFWAIAEAIVIRITGVGRGD